MRLEILDRGQETTDLGKKDPAAAITGYSAVLRQTRLFGGLRAAEVEAIAEWVRPVRLGRGEYLFREGDRTRACFVVQSGAVRVFRQSPDGLERVLHVFRAGEAFAEAALGGLEAYPANAAAMTDAVVLSVPQERFIEAVRARPQLAFAIIASLSQHLRTLVERFAEQSTQGSCRRVCEWLRQAARQGDRIELPGRKCDLANELGMTPETLSRQLRKLADEGRIVVERRTIQIVEAP